MIFKMGEMFCGPGGLALGASHACVETQSETFSIEHAWANDFNEDSCRTFQRNICQNNSCKVICKDARTIDLTELPRINAFAFGFPCNDFSVVGEKRGINGEFGALYKNGVRVIDHFEPDWFFAENVSGLRSADNGRTFQQILEDLSQAGSGYRLTTDLYKFEQYGIPQTRHRIIIIGIRNDLGFDFKVPTPTHIENCVSARKALEEPPIPDDATNQELTKQSETVVERLKHIQPGKNVWNSDLPKRLRLNVKGAKLSQIYRRLHPDEPSYTITGSGGGGTHGYHWDEPRALTNRERARLQTFPDNFVFEGSKESVRKQIGMAVPPLGAKVILEAIMKTFAGYD